MAPPGKPENPEDGTLYRTTDPVSETNKQHEKKVMDGRVLWIFFKLNNTKQQNIMCQFLFRC